MSSRGYFKFLRPFVSSKLNWQKLAWESQERVITAERKLREIQHVCHGTGTSMQRLTLSAPIHLTCCDCVTILICEGRLIRHLSLSTIQLMEWLMDIFPKSTRWKHTRILSRLLQKAKPVYCIILWTIQTIKNFYRALVRVLRSVKMTQTCMPNSCTTNCPNTLMEIPPS